MPYGNRPTNLNFDGYSDGDLLSLVRAGETSAYAGLYRRHRASAIRFAQRFSDPEIAQDVVQDSFLKILKAVNNGRGPREEFAAYLMRTIRNDLTDRSRMPVSASIDGVDDSASTTPAVSDVVEDAFDHDQIARAFASLEKNWQEVLWLTEVEQLPPREVAGYFRITPNAVSQLAHRARRGLKVAWLQTHVPALQTSHDCRATIAVLGAFASGQLSQHRTESVREHISDCTQCALAMAELNELSTRRRTLLIPLVLASPSLLTGLSEVMLRQGPRTDSEQSERSSEDLPIVRKFDGSAVAGRVLRMPSGKILTVLATGAAVVAVVIASFVLRPTQEPAKTAESSSQSSAERDSSNGSSDTENSRTDDDGPDDDNADDERQERTTAPWNRAANDSASSSSSAADDRTNSERPTPRGGEEAGANSAPLQPGPTTGGATPIEGDPSTPPKESEAPVEPIPTEPPEAALAPPSVQGPQSGSYTTPVTLTGTGEPGALVKIVDAAGADAGTATVASDGTWSRRVLPGPPDQTTSYNVTQEKAGKASKASSLAENYVYLAPAIAGPLNGSSSELFDIDSDGQPDAIFLQLNLEQEQPFAVLVDGERTDFTPEPAGSSVEFAVPLSPGEHTIGVAYRDPADGTLGAVRETTFTAFAP